MKTFFHHIKYKRQCQNRNERLIDQLIDWSSRWWAKLINYNITLFSRLDPKTDQLSTNWSTNQPINRPNQLTNRSTKLIDQSIDQTNRPIDRPNQSTRWSTKLIDIRFEKKSNYVYTQFNIQQDRRDIKTKYKLQTITVLHVNFEIKTKVLIYLQKMQKFKKSGMRWPSFDRLE